MRMMIKFALWALAAKLRGFPWRFNFDKKSLIDRVFGHDDPAPRSFADLGGVWGINAAYTFYTLDSYNITRAFLVDTHPSEKVIDKARSYKNLTIINSNFGEESIPDKIESVDVIFMFDVLLHQVAPDWDEVLDAYSKITKYFIIYNQQWIGSENTVRLFDLGREEYFKNVPHDPKNPTYVSLFEQMYEINPTHNRIWRDIHSVWQWGITDSLLIAKMKDLGFVLEFSKNYGPFGRLQNFENHGFIFKKS